MQVKRYGMDDSKLKYWGSLNLRFRSLESSKPFVFGQIDDSSDGADERSASISAVPTVHYSVMASSAFEKTHPLDPHGYRKFGKTRK
jgi:hypothetical protein